MSLEFSKLESEILSFWNREHIFEKTLAKQSPKGDYVFYDGPPFATGLPHYGHILGSVLKDVVPRYWTMRGYHVARRWGWDCHGLPIENIVEKELKMNSKKEIETFGVEKFNESCRAQVLTYVKEWGKTVERIGRWVDFEHSYKTMDNEYIESVWWAFKEIWKKGLMYEGKKVLLNCPRCETPIAKAEVAMDNSYKNVTEEAVFVKFKVQNPKFKSQNNLPVYFLAWTTTPWTLPGNVALAVGESIEYAKVQSGEEQYILAKERLNILKGEYTIIEKMKGKKLLGMAYEPLYAIPGIADAGGKTHTVLAGDFVTTEEGTGIVHTAVVYGEDDYLLGEKHGLPVVPLLNEKAIFGDKAPTFLRGQYFKKADALVIKDLKQRGLAFSIEQHTHSYPHCYRCDTPLFYNAIAAWFLNIQKIKPKLLTLNKKLNWHPEHFKEGRFRKSVEGAPDWNLSRNRYWASAIPIWKCERGCGAIEVIGSIAELREKGGKNVPANVDLHKHVVDTIVFPCGQCGGTMRRIQEVMDCWFESASMPFAQVHYPFQNKKWFEENFPAQYISEYTGQVRTWFYYMLVLSACLFDKIPFEHIVVTGNILAEDGAKMSKRLKNYPDPWKLFERYGVDALRYYLLTSPVTQAEDINFSEKGVDEAYKKVIMIVYNVVAFYKQYADDARVPLVATRGTLAVLDRWILARLQQLVSHVTDAMNEYDVVQAVRPIGEFVTDLSTWYVRRSRDRFKDKTTRAAAVVTLREVLLTLAKVMAPFLPFLAEYTYRTVDGETESVHLEGWPKTGKFDERFLAAMNTFRRIVEGGHALREQGKLKVRQPLATLEIVGEEYKRFPELLEIVKDELNVKEVCVVDVLTEKLGWISRKEDLPYLSLNTNLTNELKAEGIVREFIRGVNALRKHKRLTIRDTIAIIYESSDSIAVILEAHAAIITKGTIAAKLERGKVEQGEEMVIDTEKIKIAI